MPDQFGKDRRALMVDVDYFATTLIQRLERWHRLEPDGRVISELQQASAMVRRVRGVARRELDSDAKQRKEAA